jgi:LPS sulfotransferase NodH
MAPPRWSYIVWFTQRVGSTLVTQALEDAELAGRPREWLEAGSATELLARYDARDAFELRESLWRRGTTNGIFGVKYGMTPAMHAELTQLFRQLAEGGDERAAWAAMFPSCRHVYLTRRDRIRLAISWWRAIQSGEWHRPRRPDTVVGNAHEPTAARYDAAAIAHLIEEVEQRDAAIHDVFSRWSVAPHVIVYEDLIESYDATLRTLFRFLDVPDAVRVPPAAFAQLADEVSDRWYAQFIASNG